jgi:tellurite resistance protein
LITDLGGGNLSRGIEEVRENHRWVQQLRDRSNTAGGVVFGAVLLALAGGICSAVWLGFKAMLGARP